MTICEAIKKRRKELKYSQEQLAYMVGYSDKTAISKIERGLINIPQSKIVAFAQALRISPGDLLDGNVNEPPSFSDDEIELIEHFRKADIGTQTAVRKLLDVREKESDNVKAM